MGRILRFAAAAALVGALVLTPGRAEAHLKVCTGIGAFNTADDMTYLSVTTTSFEILMPGFAGICQPSALGPFVTGTGTLTGRCGEAIGTGVAEGHAFTLLWVGNQIVVDGFFDGDMTLIENPSFLPDTCVTGASSWLGPGAFALVHPV